MIGIDLKEIGVAALLVDMESIAQLERYGNKSGNNNRSNNKKIDQESSCSLNTESLHNYTYTSKLNA